MLIDTHAHLNFNAYKEDIDQVIKRTLENDIWIINIGTQYETSKKAVEIARNYSQGVYATIGLHPIYSETGLVKIKNKIKEEDFDYEKYKELAKSEKVVAIGEIGLDYYYKPKTKRKIDLFKEKQKEILLKQLKLAQELNLPVVFHCRMAHDELYKILISNFQFLISKLKGVMHSFVGTSEQLKKYLDLGFYIGFNGIIFKNIEGIDFEENIRKTPLDKILIETDCPYLTPPQVRGRNEPLYLKYIVEKIAKIKKNSFEKIAKITTENAKRLFRI
jgi:TatD DNase family protein